MIFRYNQLPIGGYFKYEPFSWQFWRKVKVGRKIVAMPMKGGFTFCTPPGVNAKTEIVLCDSEGVYIHEPSSEQIIYE